MANSEDSPSLLDARVECVDSVIVSDRENPLIEQHGIATESQFRDHFQWAADNVDFEGTELFWRIVSTPTGETSDWDFAKWDAKHQIGCRRGARPWLALAATKKRLSELSPADLVAPRLGDADTAAIEIGGDSDKLPIPSLVEPPAALAVDSAAPR